MHATFRSVCNQTIRRLGTAGRIATIGKRRLHTPAPFDWKDPLGSHNLFTEDELQIAETAESYCQERLLPRVLGISCSDSVTKVANIG